MNNVDFNEAMFRSINTSNYYPIKKSFGSTLQNCNIDAIIAYTKMSQNSDIHKTTERNIEFLVAGLCYNTIKQYSDNVKTFTKFEDVLRRLYINGTDSIRSDIESFLKLKIDENGYFHKKFASLCKRVIAYLYPNETFKFINLLNDLKYWDYNNEVKIRWATALIINKKEDKNESEEN